MKLKIFLATLIFGILGIFTQAQSIQTGRFEFVTITGDTQIQLNEMGQSTLSTFLIVNGSSVTNDTVITTDTFLDDTYTNNNNVVSGTTSTSHGVQTVVLAYVSTQPNGSTFKIVYTGTVQNYTQHGADATIIQGTFTSTAHYVTNGTFTATYFPTWSTKTAYSGALSGPDVAGSAGPTEVPASFSVKTNADYSVTILNFQVGGSLASCFVPPFTTVNDTAPFQNVPTNATGVLFSGYLRDSVGTFLFLNGYNVEPDGVSTAALGEFYTTGATLPTNLSNLGTNNSINVVYGISGGSCDGFGGIDAPFQQLPEKHEHKEHKHRDRQ